MNANELRTKSVAELHKDLNALKDELFNLRFKQALGQLENTARLKTVKKDIARVKTVLGEMNK